MKKLRKCALPIVVSFTLLTLPIPVASYANLLGSDNFNDNSKNASLWGTDFAVGGGLLAETNQHLLFTAPTSHTGGDAASRPWIANTGSYTSAWNAQIDVNLPTIAQALALGQSYAVTLSVKDAAAVGFGTTFSVDLQLGNFAGFLDRGFNSHQDLNGTEKSDVTSATTSTSAAIRISYDPATTTLSAAFDADGAVGGYSFTTFDSQNISAWGMTASSTFQVGAGGYTQGNLALNAADNVFADNFLAVPEPSSACLLLVSGMGMLGCARRRANRA